MRKDKNNLLPILALMAASLLWGVEIPMVKLGLETFPVTVFMAAKFLAASLILLPFAIRTWKPLKRKELGLLALSSLIYITFAALAINVGLTYAPSINSGIITLLGPLLLCVLSVKFLKERMNLKTFAGVLLAFAGAMVIVGKPWEVSLSGQTTLLGNTLFLLAVFGSVVATLIAKPVLKKTSSYQATFIILFVGILPIAAFSLTELPQLDVREIATSGYVALLYGIFAITLANFFHTYGLKYRQAHQVGIFSYLKTVILIIAAWFILGERPSQEFVVGAALVFIGLYLAEVGRMPRHLTLHHHHR
ncbi:MAG: DMT family transporter [Patescibacteria group bacterium]